MDLHLLRRASKALAAALAGALLLTACSSPAPTASAPTSAPTAAPAASTAAPKPAGSASPSAQVAASPVASPVASPPAAASPAVSPVPSLAPIAVPSVGTGARDRVRVAASSSITSAGIFVAVERGYFAQSGIDVEFVRFNTANEMLPAIASSQVEVANTDLNLGVLNAMSRNLPLRLVADGTRCVTDKCPLALMVRKQLWDTGTIKTLSDLKGKTVNGFPPGTTQNQRILRELQMGGLQASDVNFVNLGFPETLAAFTSGALDVSTENEPFVAAGVAQGIAVRWMDEKDIFGPVQDNVLVYGPDFATQRQEVGKRFMVGYLRGIRDYLKAFPGGQDQDAISAILAKYTQITDTALYRQMGMPQFDPNGDLILDTLKTNQQWWVDRGDLAKPLDIDAAFDRTYIDYAVSVLGKQ